MITIKQMRILEREALHQGILPIHLMENAGRKVYEIVKEAYDLRDKRIIVFAGKGNNGGDGFVAARYFSRECPVVILYFGDEGNLTEEAQLNYERVKDKIPILQIKSREDLEQFNFQPNHNHIFIDAILGVGVEGAVRDPAKLAIDYFNSVKGIKVAVDVPSGLHADTGESEQSCEADLIVTFHDEKPALQPMKEKVVIVDIGLPAKGISGLSPTKNGLS